MSIYIVFDPNVPMDIKNPEYVKLHLQYKNLVDFMLGSFMEELQIPPAKFEMACLEGRAQQVQQQAGGGGPQNPRAFHQRLFQQIWAANDIRIFVRMMTQRNVELQLQALDLIERRQSSRENQEMNEGTHTEEAGMAAAESDLIEFNEQGGDDALIETNADDLRDSLPVPNDGDGDAEEATEKEDDSEAAAAAASSTITTTDQTISDKFERLNLFFEKETVAEEEVQQRQDYLRAQRDKILEIKKRTRARQLNDTVTKSKRPSSAQAAAQKILSGQATTDTLLLDAPQSLMLRRVLAKRLREEVVDGKRGEQ